jgi:hypothetical protein
MALKSDPREADEPSGLARPREPGSLTRNDLLLLAADARRIPLGDGSVQCIVTSPPYWGLRKYAGEQDLVWAPTRAARKSTVRGAFARKKSHRGRNIIIETALLPGSAQASPDELSMAADATTDRRPAVRGPCERNKPTFKAGRSTRPVGIILGSPIPALPATRPQRISPSRCFIPGTTRESPTASMALRQR